MVYLIRYIIRTLIWLLILAGLIVGGLRLTLANVGFFRAEIETWVSEELASDIGFGDIRCYWSGINPILELEKAAINLPDRSRPIAIDVLSIQFDLWDSLILGTPVILEVDGTVEKLIVRKDNDNQWWLNDIVLNAGDGSDAMDSIENMLASIPHYLQLELKRLIIEDETKQRVHQINNIFVDIQHHDEATHIQLLANLPEALGGSLKLRSLLEEDKGVIYLKTEQLKLDPITALLNVPIESFRRVEMAGEIWIDLREHRLSAIGGDFSINKASYQTKLDQPAVPFQLAINFNASLQDQNWRVVNRVKSLVINQQPLADIDSQWQLISGSNGRYLQAWIKNLDIPEYLNLVKTYLPDDLRESILQSQIQGGIDDIWLSVPIKSPSELKLMAKVNGLQNQAIDLIPGINSLEAELIYAGQQVAIQLNSEQLSVDLGGEFRAPFKIDRFAARADVGFFKNEMVISLPDVRVVNKDIKVAGRFWVESDLKGAPFMSMRLSVEDGVGSQKSKYLPVKLLPKPALEWLDESIRAVDISNGAILFHGRLQDIEKLDNNKSGELRASFDIDNAEVKFDPDWEMVKQGKGRLLFHNMGVDVELDSARYAAIENVRGIVRLPTFANTTVIADIDASAPAEIALPFWLASPVGEDFREIAKNLVEPNGHIKANIKLNLPLEDERLSEQVDVVVNLEGVSVKAPEWDLELSRAHGQLQINNDSISGKAIKAYYFKDPVTIDVATNLKRKQTLIRSHGLVDTRQLVDVLPESLAQGVEGKSIWQVNLAIANTPQPANKPILTIDIASSLEGTEIYLPEPYSKSPDVKRRTTGTINLLENNQLTFKINYGSHVKIRGLLDDAGHDGLQLADLEMALGTSLKAQPVRGISLYGNLPRLPLDEWVDLRQALLAQQAPGSRSLMPLLRSVDLAVTEVAFFGRTINDFDFLLNQSDQGFSGTIDSSAAKGKFFFPNQDTVQNPVALEMDYVRVPTKVGPDSVTSWIPSDFFNMRFRSQSFAIEEREVFDLEIDTSLDEESLLIDALTFKHKKVDFKSSGYWRYSSESQLHDSHMTVSIKGEEFGQTLAALDFGDTIHNGRLNFNGEINWPAAIMEPGWDIINGKGRFKLDDGILKDVEPGSGRFVGLLSLSALPRRLFLDFSDVLFDGLEFDDIKGDLVLDGQSLYTSNTKMDGPAAEIKIIGKTGMRDRDYDQKIYVVPKFRQALPLIGGALGGSPVGWSLLLFQTLFKSSIDESVALEYSMTGSWDDPVITSIYEPELNVNELPEGPANLEK